MMNSIVRNIAGRFTSVSTMDFDGNLQLEPTKAVMKVSILESSLELPRNILDMDPHPSDYTLAQFSSAVYTNRESGETFANYGKRLGLPEGWSVLAVGSNTNGYFGVGFVNIKLQQVVVAHQGTDNFKDFIADVWGPCLNHIPSCVNSAITFVEHIRQIIQSVNDLGMRYNLTITGHSLGGWLAQITGFTVKCVKESHGALVKNTGGGLYAKTVAFDSPGAKPIMEKIWHKFYIENDRDSLSRLDITVYVAPPNLVNTCGAHIGTVNFVCIDVSKFSHKEKTTYSYHSKSHEMINFVNAFKNSSQIVLEVLDWPTGSIEYLELELDLNEILKQGNNIYTFKENNYEYLDKKIKRCCLRPNRSPPDSFSRSFNLFSEDELSTLKILNSFNKQQSNLKVLNKFLVLRTGGKLFPDFEINLNDRTITCQSKQLFEELSKLLKQLWRWLKTEFRKAVEDQREAINREVDTIYSDEGQRYLDSTAKSFINFNDSIIGLRNFLDSDFRVLCIVTQDGTFDMIRLHNIFCQLKQSSILGNYTADSYYTCLGWPRLQLINQTYGTPIDQNNLMIVDGSSSSIITSEVLTFLNNNYMTSFLPAFKKLVFVSSQRIYEDNNYSFEKIKVVESNPIISLKDLTIEAQNDTLQRKFILIGNAEYSLQDLLTENCTVDEIIQFVSTECLKEMATNKEHVSIITDTRPTLINLQILEVNIKTNIKFILTWLNSRKTLVVMSGLNPDELEPGAVWEQLAQREIIFAEGDDAERIFKDTCHKNHKKTIYRLEVFQGEIFCKQIFNEVFHLPRNFLRHTPEMMGYYEPIAENILSETATNSNLVIIKDEPGMGKSSSLIHLSRLTQAAWVIYINVKNFQAHIKDILSEDQLTAQNVATFLMSECCTRTISCLAHGFLEYLLESDTLSKIVVLMFDGFDELDDYIQKKNVKEKLVRLFAYLVNKPAFQIFVTTREKFMEEERLNYYYFCIEPVNNEMQLKFLLVFWRSCLFLEMGTYGKEDERLLNAYTEDVLEQVKQVLGQDMNRFMGVPQKLRMLAEVFRPKKNIFLINDTINNIVRTLNPCKSFVNLIHKFYLDKTLKREKSDELEITEYIKSINTKHGELGFRKCFPDFYNQNCVTLTVPWLVKLNRHGFIRSNMNGEFEFVYPFYAEYFCAQMVVRMLSKQNSITRQLIKDILMPKILLHSNNKKIRFFINQVLNETPMLKSAIKLIAKNIRQLCRKDDAMYTHHPKALRIAHQESNQHIITLLLKLNYNQMFKKRRCYKTKKYNF